MNWQKRLGEKHQVAIYSNRPPKEIKGGAVKVIADLPVKVWIGPSDQPVPDAVWDQMSDAEKHRLDGPLPIDYNDKTFKVYMFPVSQSLYDAHYTMISNGLIWPILHSTDADALVEPSNLARTNHQRNYDYQYVERKPVDSLVSIGVQPNGTGENGTGVKRPADKIVNSGFEPDSSQFASEMRFVEAARGEVRAILEKPEYAIFDPESGKYPLTIQENFRGVEIDFSNVQISPQDKAGAETFESLKRDIKDKLEALEKDPSINPSVQRSPDGPEMPLMRTHIESESRTVVIPRDPEKDYELYKQFNDLGNRAIAKLKHEGVIGRNELIWVHDYQCANAAGSIFSSHIPFPTLKFLEQVKVTGKPLLESGYFQDYLTQVASHPLVTFQRSVDMENFIAAVAAVDPKFKVVNRRVYGERPLKGFEIGESISLTMFGNTVQVMNLPVPIDKDISLKMAQESKLDRTSFEASELDRMELPYDPASVKNDRVPLKAVLGDILDTDQEHRIFLAGHRNDYSKNSLEKIYAAGNYLARHPEEKGKTHFVFFLEPTRSHVAGYKRYRRSVENMAKGLREKWGDSIVVIPASIDAQDYFGLMRHPNTVALLGTAMKDGHDLTLREAASVCSDYLAGDLRAGLAIVTTNGTGASDILAGTKENPGAFVIDSHDKTFAQMHTQLTDTIEAIVELNKTDQGKRILAARYHRAAEESGKYNPFHFYNTVMDKARSGEAVDRA